MFSDYSGNLGTIYNVPSQSTVVGQVSYIPTPGIERRPVRTSATPTASAFRPTAKHLAAAVAFIKWMEQPANQAAFAGANGPQVHHQPSRCRPTAAGLSALVASHKVPGAATLPICWRITRARSSPAGAPPWYAQFSNAVYTNIHSAAAGSGVGGCGDQRDRATR